MNNRVNTVSYESGQKLISELGFITFPNALIYLEVTINFYVQEHGL